MDFKQAEDILIRGNVSKSGDFIKENLEKKIENLQEEHLLVLKAFYDIGDQLNNFSDSESATRDSYTDVSIYDISEKVNLSHEIIDICFNDLSRDGLIIMTNTTKFYYYISLLGVNLIKNINKVSIDG